MTPPSPNIYWRDAISEGLTIIKDGRAYVALRGADRLRIYWHGGDNEQPMAIATMDAYRIHNTTEGDNHVQE